MLIIDPCAAPVVNVQPANVNVNVEAPRVDVAVQPTPVQCEIHPNMNIPVTNHVLVQPATVSPVFQVPTPEVTVNNHNTVNNTVEAPRPEPSVPRSDGTSSSSQQFFTPNSQSATHSSSSERSSQQAGVTLNLGHANMLAGCQGVFNFFVNQQAPPAAPEQNREHTDDACPAWAPLLVARLLALAWDETTRQFAADITAAMNSRKQLLDVVSRPQYVKILATTLGAQFEAALATAPQQQQQQRWEQSLLRHFCADTRDELPAARTLFEMGEKHFMEGVSKSTACCSCPRRRR